MPELKNTGVILVDLEPQDLIFGANTRVKHNIVIDGKWIGFYSDGELQYSIYYDTMCCFPYDTEILMEDYSKKRISEIKKGEYVISHTGKKQIVTEVMKRKGEDKLYNIHIKGLYNPIRCTKEHPILTLNGWINAEELTVNDRVLIPTTQELIKDLTIKEVEKNKDFLWLLGFYLAEGSLGNKQKVKSGNNDVKLKVNGTGEGSGTVSFSISKDEQEYADKIIRICKELFDINFNIYKSKEGNGMLVQGYNVSLRNLLNELGGRGSQTKKINKRLMFIEPKLQINILKGWLDGDGCYKQDKRKIIGVSISENLIQQMYRILLRNEIKSNLRKREAYDIHKEAYELHIYGTQCNKVVDWGLKDLRPNGEIDLPRRIPKFKDNCLVQKIKKIEVETLQKATNVYNLEVENDHSYIVENVAVHNCVTFAAIKIVSAIMNYKIRLGLLSKSNLNWLKENKYINDKGEFDASERFTGAMSGTTERGNSGRKVWDSIRNHGLVPQHLCDWDRGRDVEYDKRFGAWFRDIANITQEAKDIGLEFKRRFNVFYEAVLFDTESKKEEALKHSPIEVFIPTSCKYKGTVQQYCDGTIGHAVSRVEYFNPKGYVPLFDHYIKQPKEEGNERFVRRVVSNYKYHPYGYVCTIEENNMENDFVKIVKDEDSKAVGFFIPATSPDALETMSKAFNKDIVKKADGSVDWSKTIEGKVKFNS